MSVRRLAEPAFQSKDFSFTAENRAWADEVIADVSAIQGSLDIVFGEVDR
jgi:NADH:ubiquinone oxidoreductase subunit D